MPGGAEEPRAVQTRKTLAPDRRDRSHRIGWRHPSRAGKRIGTRAGMGWDRDGWLVLGVVQLEVLKSEGGAVGGRWRF